MIQITPTLSVTPVSHMVVLPPELHHGPTVAWISPDSQGTSSRFGSACGNMPDALQAAIGEYAERREFEEFFKGRGICQRNLKDFPGSSLASSLQRVIRQTAMESEVSDNIENHGFHTRSVFNIFSGEKTPYPEVILSLYPQHPDRDWYPISDSNACAVHTSPSLAIKSALFEFIERQALILHWLTGFVTEEWILPDRENLPEETRLIMDCVNPLGNLRCFEISPFSNACVLLFIFQGKPHKGVQFCVSSSANSNGYDAFRKGLLELWQSFRFIYSNLDQTTKVKKDIFQQQFLQANIHETAASFPAWQKNLPCRAAPAKRVAFNDENTVTSLLQELEQISHDLFIYLNARGRGSMIDCFAKVTSPDFFLHMSVPDLNLHNRFLEWSGRPLIPGQEAEPLPFP